MAESSSTRMRTRSSRNQGACDVLKATRGFDEDRARVYARRLDPTRWVDDELLQSFGLYDDFQTLATNAGLSMLVGLDCDTFETATKDFLSSFEDTLSTHGHQCSVSFTLNGVHYSINFEDFCASFGFDTEGDLGISDIVAAKSVETWGHISVRRDAEYLKAKISTVQNPTLRYFIYFLANTIFGRGEIGALTASDVSTVHVGLHPHVEHKPNLGALLIAQFRRQKNAPSGTIRVGGLVTQLLTFNNIAIPDAQPVAGSKVMDRIYLTSTHFLGVYGNSRHERAFQFTYTRRGQVIQELLPFSAAFSVFDRADWVLNDEQHHAARIADGREPNPDPFWDAAGGQLQ